MPRSAVIAFSLLFLATPAQAQGYLPHADGWQFGLAPSLWLPAMDGGVTARGVASRIDLESTDILDEIEFSGQLHVEAKKGDWAFMIEPTYVIAEDDDASASGAAADVEVEYWLIDLLAAYRFSRSWEVLGGLRRVSMDNRVDVNGGARVSQDESWVDLVAGARYSRQLSQKWSFLGHVDVSGFDIGDSSDFTWNASAIFFYDFAPNSAFMAGYRILDIDFEDGSGANKFEFDVQQQGPFFGVNFRWPRR